MRLENTPEEMDVIWLLLKAENENENEGEKRNEMWR